LPCDAPQAGILHRGRELQYPLSRGTRVLVRGQSEMARGSSRSNRRPNRGRLRLLGLARRRPRTYSGVRGCGNLASRGLPALSLLQDFKSQPNRPTEVTVPDGWQRLTLVQEKRIETTEPRASSAGLWPKPPFPHI
jgi:hypothetical protein